MSSENEVRLYGYIKGAQSKGNYGLATIVVDKYDTRSKKFEEVEFPVLINHPQNAPDYDKLTDGKPVRFKGELAHDRNGNIALKGFVKLFYLGKFEDKSAPAAAPQPVGGALEDDEPPF